MAMVMADGIGWDAQPGEICFLLGCWKGGVASSLASGLWPLGSTAVLADPVRLILEAQRAACGV